MTMLFHHSIFVFVIFTIVFMDVTIKPVSGDTYCYVCASVEDGKTCVSLKHIDSDSGYSNEYRDTEFSAKCAGRCSTIIPVARSDTVIIRGCAPPGSEVGCFTQEGFVTCVCEKDLCNGSKRQKNKNVGTRTSILELELLVLVFVVHYLIGIFD